MFEKLQEERRGTRPKERMRLWVTVAVCLVLGTAIYGGKSGCAGDEPDRFTPTTVEKVRDKEKAEAPKTELDRTPLLPLAESTGAADEFDAQALDYVVSELRRGKIVRAPWKTLSPSEVRDADPKEAIGRTIETRGLVRFLDREQRKLPGSPDDGGRLWAFALEGEDGKQIAVVHAGSNQELEEGKPAAAYVLPGSGSGTRLKDGDLVQVRGVYLQRRTGTIARVSLDGPTPVLVGREYRFTESPNPPLESPTQASFEKIRDRFLGGMRSVESDAARQIVQWAQTVGHEEIARRIRSGELKAAPWLRGEFGKWRREMAAEKDGTQPDKREWAPAQRGQLFWTPGVVGDFLREDWDQIPPNAQGVDRRWKFYMLSDFDGYLTLVYDSPFPHTDFPGITGRPQQRVQAFGIYVQANSFEVKGKTKEGELQSPFFVLLDLRPLNVTTGTPVLENPFFWTWVSLAVFGLAFFLVMSRIERKESAASEAQQLRIRRRQREQAKARASSPGEGRSPPPGATPPAGGVESGPSP